MDRSTKRPPVGIEDDKNDLEDQKLKICLVKLFLTCPMMKAYLGENELSDDQIIQGKQTYCSRESFVVTMCLDGAAQAMWKKLILFWTFEIPFDVKQFCSVVNEIPGRYWPAKNVARLEMINQLLRAGNCVFYEKKIEDCILIIKNTGIDSYAGDCVHNECLRWFEFLLHSPENCHTSWFKAKTIRNQWNVGWIEDEMLEGKLLKMDGETKSSGSYEDISDAWEYLCDVVRSEANVSRIKISKEDIKNTNLNEEFSKVLVFDKEPDVSIGEIKRFHPLKNIWIEEGAKVDVCFALDQKNSKDIGKTKELIVICNEIAELGKKFKGCVFRLLLDGSVTSNATITTALRSCGDQFRIKFGKQYTEAIRSGHRTLKNEDLGGNDKWNFAIVFGEREMDDGKIVDCGNFIGAKFSFASCSLFLPTKITINVILDDSIVLLKYLLADLEKKF